MIQQETAEETKTEISELDEEEKVLSSGEEAAPDEDSGSIEMLFPSLLSSSISRRPSLPVRTEPQRRRRRHSVPLSVPTTLTVPTRATVRRESLPNDNNKPKHHFSKLEDQIHVGRSSLSLLSSKSSLLGSSANTSAAEKPVSAENLLPEPSIASITNSTEASRLSSVLQPDIQRTQQRLLTRQQTFPPLQPYVRTRSVSKL